VATLLGLLAAGCGGSDGDDGPTRLTKDDAPDAVARALLDEGDLGDGWDQTGTVASDEAPDRPDPVETCLGASVQRGLEPAELAVSERRDFERGGDEQFESTRVQVRTIAVKTGEALDPVFALFEDESFLDCLGSQLEPQVSDEPSELLLQVGEPDVDTDDYLPLDGVRSSRVSIPFHASAPGFTFDADLGLVLVNRDQLASFLLTIHLRGGAEGEDVARWAGLLADRQRLAQTAT
jgi:hypothetical protein